MARYGEQGQRYYLNSIIAENPDLTSGVLLGKTAVRSHTRIRAHISKHRYFLLRGFDDSSYPYPRTRRRVPQSVLVARRLFRRR